MLDEPSLTLQDLAMLACHLQQVLPIALLFINAVSQSFELSLIFLELINLLLQVDEGSSSIVAFVELPIGVVIVETRLLSLLIFDELIWVPVEKLLHLPHHRVCVHQRCCHVKSAGQDQKLSSLLSSSDLRLTIYLFFI